MGLFGIGLVIIVVVVLTWNAAERKRDERDAAKDINELMNRGYSYKEAVFLVTNAKEMK